MRQTDFVESVFMETSAEQVDAVLYQAMFDEIVRLRRCTSQRERGSIRKFLTESYRVFAERNLLILWVREGGDIVTLENRLRSNGVKVEGTFNARNFFDTLSRICSNKYGADIKIKSFRMKAPEEPEAEEINIA